MKPIFTPKNTPDFTPKSFIKIDSICLQDNFQRPVEAYCWSFPEVIRGLLSERRDAILTVERTSSLGQEQREPRNSDVPPSWETHFSELLMRFKDIRLTTT